MTEHLIAKDLTVICPDGSEHPGVILIVRDGKRFYQTPDGMHLCAERIEGGLFLVSAEVATAIMCRCPMEVD
jgi:hypothetical protein